MRITNLLVTGLLCLCLNTVALAEQDIEVGFSPAHGGQSALNVVLDGITNAQSEILVAAYSFTSKPIAAALVDAQERGVTVRVVADKKGIAPNTQRLHSLRTRGSQFVSMASTPFCMINTWS